MHGTSSRLSTIELVKLGNIHKNFALVTLSISCSRLVICHVPLTGVLGFGG